MIRRAVVQAFWALRIAYLEHLHARIALLDPGHEESGLVLLELNHAYSRLQAAMPS